MSVATFTKDPAAKANFSIDYTTWLTERGVGITLVGSTWSNPAGITQLDATFTTTTTTIRLSGGTDGEDYEVVNHFILSDGQEDEKSLTIRVRQSEATAVSDSADRANALTVLQDLAQPDAAPTLTTSEVEAILDRSKYASTWLVSKAYKIGDIVVPAIRNGHCYECVQPGTSQGGARTYTDWPTITGQVVSDGSSDPVLLWEEAGSDVFNPRIAGEEHNVYDIGRAARECWLLKARKATQAIDDGDVSFSQWREHCLEQAKHFYPIRRQIQIVRC